MFQIQDNVKIGKYLLNLIEQKYESRRKFCRDYLITANLEVTDVSVNNMSNRVMQIVNGNKAIQTYDLPIFTQLLGASCEEILSAGEIYAPVSNRVTNYSIARSKDRSEWEKYINRSDKLVLNSDEYCKTVLDYALEFGNYDFIKFLMDNGYIWFDSRNDNDYIQTFGAGTSIKRREIGYVDYGFESKLKTEDELRIKLIALAADKKDLKMLNELRARENPQLYYKAHYLFGTHPDFDNNYNETMVRHIASSSDEVLDYFTDSFEIRDHVRYKDGSKKAHTFMFPYISKLLDFLVSNNAPFAETAIKKAIKYNKSVLNKLQESIRDIKNDVRSKGTYTEDFSIMVCSDAIKFYENGDIIVFFPIYLKDYLGGFITNIAKLKKIPTTPILKQLASELNESYNAIINLKEHLEEI